MKFGAGERKYLLTKGYGLTSKARFGPFASKHESRIAGRKSQPKRGRRQTIFQIMTINLILSELKFRGRVMSLKFESF